MLLRDSGRTVLSRAHKSEFLLSAGVAVAALVATASAAFAQEPPRAPVPWEQGAVMRQAADPQDRAGLSHRPSEQAPQTLSLAVPGPENVVLSGGKGNAICDLVPRKKSGGTAQDPAMVCKGTDRAGEGLYFATVGQPGGSVLLGGKYGWTDPETGKRRTLGEAATSIGVWSEAPGIGATAVGNSAKAHAMGATAIGKEARAMEDRSVAIGYAAEATGGGGVAIGGRDPNAAVGAGARAHGPGAIAIGAYSYSKARDANAVGRDAHAYWEESVAFGAGAVAGTESGLFKTDKGLSERGRGAMALGTNSKALAPFSVAIGYGAEATAKYQVVLGTKNHSYVMPGLGHDNWQNISPDQIREWKGAFVTTDGDGKLSATSYDGLLTRVKRDLGSVVAPSGGAGETDAQAYFKRIEEATKTVADHAADARRRINQEAERFITSSSESREALRKSSVDESNRFVEYVSNKEKYVEQHAEHTKRQIDRLYDGVSEKVEHVKSEADSLLNDLKNRVPSSGASGEPGGQDGIGSAQLAELQTSLHTQGGQIVELQAKTGELRTDVDQQKEQLRAVSKEANGRVQSVTKAMTGLRTELAAQNDATAQRFAKVDETATGLRTDLDTHKSDTAQRFEMVGKTTAALQDGLDSQKTELNEHRSATAQRFDRVESDLSDHQVKTAEQFSEVNKATSSLKEGLETQSGQITGLQAGLKTQGRQIADLRTKTGELEVGLVAQGGQINELQKKTAVIEVDNDGRRVALGRKDGSTFQARGLGNTKPAGNREDYKVVVVGDGDYLGSLTPQDYNDLFLSGHFSQVNQRMDALESGFGSLNARMEQFDHRMDEAEEGIAMALALAGPLPDFEKVAFSANLGGFGGKQAMAFAAGMRLAPNVIVSTGLGVGLNKGTIGYRFGVSWAL
ncbi:YadA-like family protein [Rhodoligotrophos defluvii]|uniref:YadA-like family protein n=1 Tax=Rhodoligotrophos defluvii TaxID=2561934 RepID=UPI0010C9F5A6|nr:YadA-like family protein [Rhodoligotrophos defluvii]